MYRSIDQRREFGVLDGPFTGAHVIDVGRMSARDRTELAERLDSSSPILAARKRAVVPWAAPTLVVSLATLVALALLQLGEMGAPMASQGEWAWPVLYATLGALAVASAASLAVAVRYVGWRSLPQGTFLFPLDLLVVSGRRVHVTPFGDARVAVIDEEARSVALTYADGSVVTVSGERASKASLLSELLAAQRLLEDATLTGSSTADVLGSIRKTGWDSVEAGGAAPGGASAPKAALLALSAAAGVGLGLGVWNAREIASDDAIFQQARAANTSAAYVTYLQQGTRHEAVVRQQWLPAAVRTEAGDSIVELDRFVQNFFPSAEVELGKASLHVACDKYARSQVPVSPPTEFGDDGFDVPPMSATPGWSFDHNSSGHRTRDEICVSELGRASLDDALRFQEPVKLWDHLRWDDDPQRAVEARAAAGTALDALVAAVRVNATDAESRGELVALLELARASERPALVFVDDRTALPRSRFYLSLRGVLRFVFARADLGRPPDATWTFTKLDGGPVTVVMARGEKRIERTFAVAHELDAVMRAFLDQVVGWPTPAPAHVSFTVPTPRF